MTQPILEVRNLKKTYSRGFIARRQTFSLEGSFKCERPEIIGVMGPNGAGKTTLFELLSGSNVPTAGQIICGGGGIFTGNNRPGGRQVISRNQPVQAPHGQENKPSLPTRARSAEETLGCT